MKNQKAKGKRQKAKGRHFSFSSAGNMQERESFRHFCLLPFAGNRQERELFRHFCLLPFAF
jgi:hypothetical protein